MLRAGIIGASGYAGEKLIDILLKHPKVKITYLVAQIEKKLNINKLFPHLGLRIDLECDNRLDKHKASELCEVLFLALPHTVSLQFVPDLLSKGARIIDLSADYRLIDPQVYERFYKVKHPDKKNIKKAVYGLPELYRAKIKTASLVANPGCYPTAAILALTPLLKKNLIRPDEIIIDAKSGFSGAGREAVASQQKEILGNFKAYKINTHQHIPEIDQELSKISGERIRVVFVPHILPLEKGILETIYVKKKPGFRIQDSGVINLYKKYYAKEPFVRVLEEGKFPQLKDVVGTNFCDIGIREDAKNIIIIAAIDNLFKGASGQAVQNLNIMFHFPEETALQ
jgi:N-acetyl-gamma-glutamyl-phosphate reductase